MTIRRVRSELVCECDECGHEEYGGALEFRDFIAELKADGWRIRKDGETWTHTCPDCVREVT